MIRELLRLEARGRDVEERLGERLGVRLAAELATLERRRDRAGVEDLGEHLAALRAGSQVLAALTARGALELAAALGEPGLALAALEVEMEALAGVGWPVGLLAVLESPQPRLRAALEALDALAAAGMLPAPETSPETLAWAAERLGALVEVGKGGALSLQAWGAMREGLRASPPMLPLATWPQRSRQRNVWPGLLEGVRLAVLRAGSGPQAGGLQQWAAPVNKAPVRVAETLAGASMLGLGDAELPAEGGPLGFTVHWPYTPPTGSPMELQLPLEFDPAEMTLWAALTRRYGLDAARDLMGMLVLAWASGVRSREAFWLYPRELELLTGIDLGDTRASERLDDLLSDFNRSILVARYKHNQALSAPIVQISALPGTTKEELRRNPARQVKIHESLTSGSLGAPESDGRFGDYWWPMPADLLRQPKRSALLTYVLAELWRAELGARSRRRRRGGRKGGPDTERPLCARIKSGRLMEALGIRGRAVGGGALSDRKQDGRAAVQLRKALEAAREAGMVGGWRLLGGEGLVMEGEDLERAMASGEAVLEVYPGEKTAPARGLLPRPARLPNTGTDLKRWLSHKGWSCREASRQLEGVTYRTLARAVEGESAPVPPSVRDAVRAYLWGEEWR